MCKNMTKFLNDNILFTSFLLIIDRFMKRSEYFFLFRFDGKIYAK